MNATLSLYRMSREPESYWMTHIVSSGKTVTLSCFLSQLPERGAMISLGTVVSVVQVTNKMQCLYGLASCKRQRSAPHPLNNSIISVCTKLFSRLSQWTRHSDCTCSRCIFQKNENSELT